MSQLTFELKEESGEREDGGRDQVRRACQTCQHHSQKLRHRICQIVRKTICLSVSYYQLSVRLCPIEVLEDWNSKS